MLILICVLRTSCFSAACAESEKNRIITQYDNQVRKLKILIDKKDEKPEEIHRAIYQVLDGGVPMSPLIARKSLNLIRTGRPSEREKVDYGLTARETEILEHLSNGLSYDQIASNLFISKGTVRKHIENTYRKLQVNNKVEAIKKMNH